MSAAADRYPWFDIVQEDALEQGDILRSFPVLVPEADTTFPNDQVQAELRTLDAVIMTQSCDIENVKVRSLLPCPVHDLWRFVEEAKKRNENWGADIRDKLRQGNLPGYHLLNEAGQEGLVLPLAVVDFHEVYTAPAAQVRAFASAAGKRLRLCPPYREHLAQAFARFFMRVGLPIKIPREKLKSPT